MPPFRGRKAVGGRTWVTDIGLVMHEDEVLFGIRVTCVSHGGAVRTYQPGLDMDNGIPPGPSSHAAGEDSLPVRFGGNQLKFLQRHLRCIGNSREPRRCLAGYYLWDASTSRVVVGWLPSHLKNRLADRSVRSPFGRRRGKLCAPWRTRASFLACQSPGCFFHERWKKPPTPASYNSIPPIAPPCAGRAVKVLVSCAGQVVH